MFFTTSHNTGYAVPLRFTHIAIATSHIQKRYTPFFGGKFMKVWWKSFLSNYF